MYQVRRKSTITYSCFILQYIILYITVYHSIPQYTTVYYIAIHYSEYCHPHLILRWRALAMISFRRCWTGRWWTGGTSVRTRSPFSTLGGSSGRRDCCVVSSEHPSEFGSTIAPIPPLYTSLIPRPFPPSSF